MIIALMMEAVNTSETSVSFYQATRRNIPEDSHLHTHRRKNLKSHQENFFLKRQDPVRGEKGKKYAKAVGLYIFLRKSMHSFCTVQDLRQRMPCEFLNVFINTFIQPLSRP
jgi:hypothetical protein